MALKEWCPFYAEVWEGTFSLVGNVPRACVDSGFSFSEGQARCSQAQEAEGICRQGATVSQVFMKTLHPLPI